MQEIYILQINTAFSEANISISRNGVLIHEVTNPDQYDHASFLQPAVMDLCIKSNININQLNAVSVINGPGSYTGLRVGLSSAKGICYALSIPLICINTLTWIAYGNQGNSTNLVCSMIDARRNEVFTAVYNKQGDLIIKPTAMILDETSFKEELDKNTISFVGDGAEKWSNMCSHPNASFPISNNNAKHLSAISFSSFNKQEFSDLTYSEPYYIKEFFSTQRK